MAPAAAVVAPGEAGSNPRGGDPIDLASGLVALRTVDLAVSGSRGSLSMHSRVYRTMSTEAPAHSGSAPKRLLITSLDTYDPQGRPGDRQPDRSRWQPVPVQRPAPGEHS